jgi:hypothetical protein
MECKKLDFFLSLVVCPCRLSSLLDVQFETPPFNEKPGGALDEVGN